MLFKAQALGMRARDDHDIHDNSEMIPGLMRPATGESPRLLSKLAHQIELQTGAFSTRQVLSHKHGVQILASWLLGVAAGMFYYVSVRYAMADSHGEGRLRAEEDPTCPSQSFRSLPKIAVTHIHRWSTEQSCRTQISECSPILWPGTTSVP